VGGSASATKCWGDVREFYNEEWSFVTPEPSLRPCQVGRKTLTRSSGCHLLWNTGSKTKRRQLGLLEYACAKVASISMIGNDFIAVDK